MRFKKLFLDREWKQGKKSKKQKRREEHVQRFVTRKTNPIIRHVKTRISINPSYEIDLRKLTDSIKKYTSKR